MKLLALCASGLLFAGVANMSGTWKLNVKRSEWGNKPAPDHVFITIEHNDPSLKYSGSVQAPGESNESKFEFNGAIDGKEYTLKDDEGTHRVRMTRKSDNSIETVMIGPDGETQGTSTTTLAADGKTMFRKVRAKLANGQTSEWTEVYEKQK